MGCGRVSPHARIAPVEVPATRSKRLEVGRPVRCSISVSTSAGISPRMPPPSMAKTFMSTVSPVPYGILRKSLALGGRMLRPRRLSRRHRARIPAIRRTPNMRSLRRAAAILPLLVLGAVAVHLGSAKADDTTIKSTDTASDMVLGSDGDEPQTIEEFLTAVTKDVDTYWTKVFKDNGLPEPR